MAVLAELEQSLLRILWELRPYLPDVVVIGGWVPHLYRRFGGFRTWKGELSLTGEVDALVAPVLPAGGRPPMATILRQAGFQPIIGGPMAAVWADKPEVGEKIEFLVDHRGPFKSVGEIRAVAQQPGLGAIALDGLWFLHRHATTLEVPSGAADPGVMGLQIRVPCLGAYVINKAATFSQRRELREEASPKRAKDLLYIRDLMAAGDEVVERIAADLQETLKADRHSKVYTRRAAKNLKLLCAGSWGEELREAANMLGERTVGTSFDAAMADLRGHTADLSDLLKEKGA